MDEKKLLKYAVYYLSKYDSSKKNLENILKRKIFRLKLKDIEKHKLLNTIDSLTEILEKNNFLDDTRYISSKISTLSRVGKSKNFIFNYLINKGVNKSDVDRNFQNFQKNNNEWELHSAKLFIKKKRLLESNESYEKKLSKMARAGFSYEISKKVLG